MCCFNVVSYASQIFSGKPLIILVAKHDLAVLIGYKEVTWSVHSEEQTSKVSADVLQNCTNYYCNTENNFETQTKHTDRTEGT